MTIQRWCLTLWIGCAVFAQERSRTGISGTVRDLSTGLPLSHARVSLTPGRHIVLVPFQEPGHVVETMTDGTYHLDVTTPGPYMLYATAPGYSPGPNVPRLVTLRTGVLSGDVDMIAASSIKGQILDGETHVPVSGILVQPVAIRYELGKPVPWPVAAPASTDKKGSFQFESLKPGQYYLEMAADKAAELATVASHRDSSKKSMLGPAYGRQTWPASTNAWEIVPLVILPGVPLDLGAVPMSRRQLYRISGELRRDSCEAGRTYAVALIRQAGTAFNRIAQATIRCGEYLTITNVAPGDYQLSIAPSGSDHSVRKYLWQTLSVFDKDLDEDLRLQPAMQITGVLRLPDSFPAESRRRLSVHIQPLEGVGLGEPQPVVTEDGRFVLTLFGLRRQSIEVAGLSAPYVVAGIFYGGGTVRDGVLMPNVSLLSQDLSVLISTKSGRLQGTVKERGESISGARVIAIPWPTRLKNDFPVFVSAVTGEDGTFALEGMPAEPYRILAVVEEAWKTTLQRPGVLSSMVAGGAESTVTEGQPVTVQLELKRVYVPQ